MAKTITLKYDGTCRDCGAALAAGTKARWYGRGRVYGTECHEQKPRTRAERDRAELHDSTRSFLDHNKQPTLSRQSHGNRYADSQFNGAQYARTISAADPTGFYNAAGECIGRQNAAGRCEDAPCCGCCA